MIFGREPARWIALAVTIILGILSALTGEGIVGDALAGRITDIVQAAAQLLTLLSPMIAAELTRPKTTPVAQPKLELGTPVLVDRPAGQPDDTPPPDAVVALRSQVRAS